MSDKVKQYFRLLAGSIIFTVGIYLFITPYGINTGGIFGLAQFLADVASSLLPVPQSLDLTGIINLIINIPLFILGWKIINKEFCFRTIISVIIQSIVLSVLPKQTSPVMPDILSSTLFGALVCGYGIGLALTSSSSLGGVDILGMCITKLRPGFSVGRFTIIFNCFLYGFLAFSVDIQTVLFSIFYIVVASFVEDKTHYQNINMVAFVFTHDESMKQKIMDKTGRGVTYWIGKGAYTDKDQYILFCGFNKYEESSFKHLIYEIDENAFVTCFQGMEILGGFEKRL